MTVLAGCIHPAGASRDPDHRPHTVLVFVVSLQKAGLSVDQVAPRFSFFFAVGMPFFEEVGRHCVGMTCNHHSNHLSSM